MAAEPKRDPWSNSKNDPWNNSKGGWGKSDDGWSSSKRNDGWSKDENDGGSKPWLWIGGGALAVLFLGIFLVAPAYKGYAVYSALDGKIPDNYVTDMTQLSNDKAAAEAAQQAAEQTARDKEREAAITQESLSACKKDYDAVNADLVKARKLKDDVMQSMSEEAAQAKQDLQLCQKDLKSAQEAETAVIADAARRLCCISRIVNSEIDSYDIVDGRIVCAAGGKAKISC